MNNRQQRYLYVDMFVLTRGVFRGVLVSLSMLGGGVAPRSRFAFRAIALRVFCLLTAGPSYVNEYRKCRESRMEYYRREATRSQSRRVAIAVESSRDIRSKERRQCLHWRESVERLFVLIRPA